MKTRRKKNVKLRRSVRKTIASLIMVMAIVVAAIPVENYGTMEAHDGVTTTVGNLHDAYTGDGATNTSDEQNDYDDSPNNTEIIGRIDSGGNYEDIVEVAKSSSNSSEVMITKYLRSNSLTSIDLSTINAYDYVIMDNAYMTAVRKALQNEKYTITFAADSTGDITYGSETVHTKINTTDSPTYTATDSQAGTISDVDNPYTKYSAATAEKVKTYFEQYSSDGTASSTDTLYNDAKSAADEFNNLNYGSQLTALTSAESPDTTAISNLISEIQTAYDAAYTKTYSFLPLTGGESDSESYTDFLKNVICTRFTDGNNTLTNFELADINKDSTQMLAPKATTSNPGAQSLDSLGYIVGGTVTYKGIADDAFTGTSLSSITLSQEIVFIGQSAFANSALQSVTFSQGDVGYSNCQLIDINAFNGCDSLTSINMEDTKLQDIGAGAFANTALTNVTIPGTTRGIHANAFEDNLSLDTVTIKSDQKGTTVIYPFAFYNCPVLNNVTFADNTKEYIIGLGAFALADSTLDKGMTEFTFPTTMSKIENDFDFDFDSTDDDFSQNDYILANRTALKTVTFPANLAGEIPDYTFCNCYNLELVKFPADGNSASYNATYDSELLFKDVTNSDFMVEGPAYKNNDSTTIAGPRQATWSAKTSVSDWVLYKFTIDDTTYYEKGDGEDAQFIARIKVNDDGTASLVKYSYNGGTDPVMSMATIPGQVEDYPVTSIESEENGESCFDAKAKKYVYKLVFEDATDTSKGGITIASGAFQGAEGLREVVISNNVKVIEANAFADCKNLENVYFNEPDLSSGWSSAITIDDTAFQTGSEYLTFHGEINPDYAPYKLAMSAAAYDCVSTDDTGICYKTDEPERLTVVYVLNDDGSGTSTLIDYPHLEEVDTYESTDDTTTNIVERFIKCYCEGNEDESVTTEEGDLISNTLNISLPEGIDSIDSTQLDSSSHNWDYTTITYNRDVSDGNGVYTCERDTQARNLKDSTTTSATPKELYSKDGLFKSEIYEAAAGLIGETYSVNGHTYVESVDDDYAGNDHLTTIDLGEVKSLPDNAFLSCENLLTATLGQTLSTVGALPFKNCKSLYGLTVDSENPYITADNLILYGKNTDSSYEIIEVLEGRGNTDLGNEYGENEVGSSDANLSKVTSIRDGAFSNCEDIVKVDLSETSVKTIPENCFEGCSTLSSVTLPSTTYAIEPGAFKDIDEASQLTITIPNQDCQFDVESFENTPKLLTFFGVKWKDEEETEPTPTYASFLNLEKVYSGTAKFYEIDQSFEVSFYTMFDKDTAFATAIVNKGESVTEPDVPEVNGYKFEKWMTIVDNQPVYGDDALADIKDTRTIIAIYSEDPATVTPDGNTYDFTATASTGTIILSNTTTGDTQTASGTVSLTDVEPGNVIMISYVPSSSTVTFGAWTVSATDSDGNALDGTDYFVQSSSASSSTAYYVMPRGDVVFTASVTDSSSSSNNSNSGSSTNSGDDDDDSTTTKYTVTVNYGTGSGDYAEGTTVTITANSPESTTKVFSKWTTDNTSVSFASATSSTTTFTMPASAVVVTANYKTKSSSDDDEDDSEAAKRRTGTTTTTTGTVSTSTASTTTSSGTTTSGTVTNTSTTDSGDQLYITKNGISNKDVGSATVDGSTDNFVVKISESDEAVTAAETALRNRYGSLDGLVYVPMDISLYDSTGKNKIEDTYGLNVTVTMPIPDVLVQYGGNVRAATADDGYLTDLNVRFTTIDGIACMSFTPPHFSPYVIYVDTNNLVEGRADATPKTGDPIHPKWFLAAGMACLSILLFATGDRKRKIKLA